MTVFIGKFPPLNINCRHNAFIDDSWKGCAAFANAHVLCRPVLPNGSAFDGSAPQVLEPQQHVEHSFELAVEMDLITSKLLQLVLAIGAGLLSVGILGLALFY
jgi:hypothetical protein